MVGTLGPILVRLGGDGARRELRLCFGQQPVAEHRPSSDESSSLVRLPSLELLTHEVAEPPEGLNRLARTPHEPWFNISAPLEDKI
jgi:hypothetical protein